MNNKQLYYVRWVDRFGISYSDKVKAKSIGSAWTKIKCKHPLTTAALTLTAVYENGGWKEIE